MTLIKSISGIRGTIGGGVGDNLTPIDAALFAAAYGSWISSKTDKKPKVIIGRDARISGKMISSIVANTLIGMGIDVMDIGLSTTPTVEMAVAMEDADGGIIITASHNPKQWNALKLLNEKGEFISAEDGQNLLYMVEQQSFNFAPVEKLGKYEKEKGYIEKHIKEILSLPLVDAEAIEKKGFKIVIDCVNSTGGIAVPMLLKALGVKEIKELYCEPNGHFPHNPEPLAEHLTEISAETKRGHFDLGIVVDPDVDRLALVCEDGEMFGEEYTLVAVADYVLKNQKGNTVSNLSSSRALSDITKKYGGSYSASAVGEVHVVIEMKNTNAIIGGEGNGGIIFPELHYGRDALVGIALFLTHLAKSDMSMTRLRSTYPNYFMSKNKIELTPEIDVDGVLEGIKKKYKKEKITTIDGVKIDFETGWVHLRKSNTEPIIRIYSEADSMATAEYLANKFISDIKELITEHIED